MFLNENHLVYNNSRVPRGGAAVGVGFTLCYQHRWRQILSHRPMEGGTVIDDQAEGVRKKDGGEENSQKYPMKV